jgi:hypothetical protein
LLFNYGKVGHELIRALELLGSDDSRQGDSPFGNETIHMIIMSHWNYASWWFKFVIALPFTCAFLVFTFWTNYVLANITLGKGDSALERNFLNPFCSIVIFSYASYSLLLQVL